MFPSPYQGLVVRAAFGGHFQILSENTQGGVSIRQMQPTVGLYMTQGNKRQKGERIMHQRRGSLF